MPLYGSAHDPQGVAELTDNSGGTAGASVEAVPSDTLANLAAAANDNFATLAAKVNELLKALKR